MNVAELSGLQIESSINNISSENFRPSSWPPPADTPVVVDAKGDLVSRYSDIRWDLSPWAGYTLTIHFGDGPGQGQRISPENAKIFRQIVAWWLWGADAVRSASSLVNRFEMIKPVFVACTDKNILVSELFKFPRVIEEAASNYSTRGNRIVSLLNSLFCAQEKLGFTILDEDGLKIFSESLPGGHYTQTAYIPERIWSYQLCRLRECLEDFLKHKKAIEACYQFCLGAYATNAGGSLSMAFGGLGNDKPFEKRRPYSDKNTGKVFHGAFREIAKDYEIDHLLDKWCVVKNEIELRSFSSYLSLISFTGLAYVLNFSLMRVSEGGKLRADCYEVEESSIGEDIHLLKGVTTKTIQDNDARWIVSPTVKIAIDAMISVSKLRLQAAKENPNVKQNEIDITNPILQSLPHEPWSPRAPSSKKTNKYKKIRTYADGWNMWPRLFDVNKMTITAADYELANRMTFDLDPDKFSVGKVWPISWHQLRRTGAVNMLASGLVNEASLQYQLKHASRAMSQYYGKNFYRLAKPLNEEARGYYLREMYLTMVREFKSLQADHYISPHGDKRKSMILNEITEKDHAQLVNAAKAGNISYRETFLGGCANSGPPCPFGGISNISSCMGYGTKRPCASAILDKEKLSEIKKLKDTISAQLVGAEEGSPMYESLQAQLESVERAINVIENC